MKTPPGFYRYKGKLYPLKARVWRGPAKAPKAPKDPGQLLRLAGFASAQEVQDQIRNALLKPKQGKENQTK